MFLIIPLQGHPHGRAALEAGAEGQLPHAVPTLHALEGLHIGPGIPAQGVQSVSSTKKMMICTTRSCRAAAYHKAEQEVAAHSCALGQGSWACHRLGLFPRLESPACPARNAFNLLAAVTQGTQREYPPGGG